MRRVQSTLQLATKQSVRLASPLQSLPLLGLSSRISGPTVNLTTRSLLLSTKPSFTISQPTRNTKVSSFASPSPPTIRFFTSFAQLNQFLFSKAPPGFKKFWPNSSEPSEEDSEDKKKNGKEEKDDDDGGGKKLPGNARNYLLAAATAGMIVVSIVANAAAPEGQEISFQEFVTKFLEERKVKSLTVVDKMRVKVYLNDQGGAEAMYYFSIGSVDWFERKLEEIQYAMELDPRDYVPIQYATAPKMLQTLVGFLPNVFLIGLWLYFMSKMGGAMGKGGKGGMGDMFNVGKSTAFEVKAGKIKTRFKDVAGLNEAKIEVMEFVKFLQEPEKFTRLGAKIPKGALLVGPPGTGKTLLAKAVAGESKRPFYSISGSDFIEMFVGVGPSRVRDLFAKARENAPCIIFIDEIDAVGKSRSKSGKFGGGNDERENTLNQLLVEMDGFQTTEGVVVLAATNRADVLDKALLRPGRFDRQITIDLPDINGRAEVFMVHLNKLTVSYDKKELAHRLAALTPGFSGADIANLCNEAALIAARSSKETIELVDFEAATDRLVGGLEKKSKILSKEERELVAYHEAGHAVIGWFCEFANPILKVTIVPRGNGALGYAQSMPSELHLYREEQLLDMMKMTLGGRAAEQVFFGKVSSGASDDLKKISQLAHAQVMQFGMSPRLLNISFDIESENNFTKNYSEATQIIIDSEVSRIIDESYAATLKLTEEKRVLIDALAQRLLKEETINHDVLVEVLGDRKYGNASYREYVENTKKGGFGSMELKTAAAAAAAAAAKIPSDALQWPASPPVAASAAP